MTILSTVPRCEWKSWISDSVQQLVEVQMRCADVKPLWESEREKTRSSWITHVFPDDWFNLIVCVDLFTPLTYMLHSINVCRNFPYYKLESCGNEENNAIYTQSPTKFWTGLIIIYHYYNFFPRSGNCGFKMSLLFHVLTLKKKQKHAVNHLKWPTNVITRMLLEPLPLPPLITCRIRHPSLSRDLEMYKSSTA